MSTVIEQIIEELDLESWLDDMAIDYRRVSGGTNLNLRHCPFCGDERWRVYVSTENKRGLCYHADCERRFNLWSFAREHLGADTAGTRRHFEDYASRILGRPRRTPRLPPAAPAMGWELPYNVAIPTEDGLSHPYLTARAILPETQRHFDMRWCEDGYFPFKDGDGNDKQMWFGGRILLPIHDLDGSIQTFVGRDATGEAKIRYLFPPNLPSAARYLYAGHHLVGAAHVVMGEGPFDAIAIHQAVKDHPDFRAVAATASFGLAIGHGEQDGNDQLGRLIKLRAQGMKRLTLLRDGEKPAFLSALKDAEMLASKLAGVEIRVGLLPRDTDPGEVDTRIVREAISAAAVVTPTQLMKWRLLCPY